MTATITNSHVADGLEIGDYPIITQANVTVLSGEDLARGCVVGAQTSGGKYIACAHDASDGSEDPVAILVEDIDASLGDITTAMIYTSGQFDSNKLTFGGTSDIDDLKALMIKNNLYTKDLTDPIG